MPERAAVASEFRTSRTGSGDGGVVRVHTLPQRSGNRSTWSAQQSGIAAHVPAPQPGQCNALCAERVRWAFIRYRARIGRRCTRYAPHGPQSCIALRQIAVAHHPTPARLIDERPMDFQKRLDLGFHRLGQKLAGAGPQYLRQRVLLKIIWGTKGNNCIFLHGVSFPWSLPSGDLDNHQDTPPSFSTPYTTFSYSPNRILPTVCGELTM